jgi:hypothetical protein
MKAIKNHKIVFTALTIILSALLVTSCINPFEAEILQYQAGDDGSNFGLPEVNLPQGKGAILLKFGDSARATVMPVVDYSDLDFTVAVSVDGKVIYEDTGRKMSQTEAGTVPIILDEGTYSILVFGYYKTSDIASYVGEATEEVPAGKTKEVSVDLKGIVSEGEGTFSYNVTIPNAGEPAREPQRVDMRIFDISQTIFDDAYALKKMNLRYPDPPATPNIGEGVVLDAGYYWIHIFVGGRTNYRDYTITWILHIYPGMNSHFECTDLPSLTRGTNLEVFFDANGGYYASRGLTYDRSPALIIQNVGDLIPEEEAGINGEEPKYSGSDFKGWYSDRHGVNKWNFDKDRVWESDITLWAKWEEKSHYTVTFHANTNDPVYNASYRYSIPVARGEPIPSGEPVEPEKPAGQKLAGWFEDFPNITWNFDTPITFDLNLYAKWENTEPDKEIVIDKPNVDVEDEADYVVILNTNAWEQGFRLRAPSGAQGPMNDQGQVVAPKWSPTWYILEDPIYPDFYDSTNDLFLTGVNNGGKMRELFVTLGLRKITIILEYSAGSPRQNYTWTFTISFREE